MDAPDRPSSPPRSERWPEVVRLFVVIGFLGFGGPAAHVAMMRDAVVRRRNWVDDQTFLDLVGACALVPGPNSTELALHLGLRRAGWRGLVAAACGFILPAVGIVMVLAALYERYGDTSAAFDLSYGIVPVIVAIVIHAVIGLTRTAIDGFTTATVGVAATAGWLLGVNELLLLVAGAVVVVAVRHGPAGAGSGRPSALALATVPLAMVPLAAASDPSRDVDLLRLGWVFLKIGAVLYGSGYVLLSFLQHDLVDRLGWLTERQLLDAVAVGQFTPGPVFTTATFVGYQVAGPAGALVATVAIFAPAFVFVALLGRITHRIRSTPWAASALDGVNAASLGLMAAVAIELAGDAFVDAVTVVLGVAALAVLVRWRVNSAWLVVAGALVGLARGLG